VEDIHSILDESDKGHSPCPTVRVLIEERIAQLERRFEETAHLLETMRTAVKKWQAKEDQEPTGHMICHLIESFISEEQSHE